MSKVWKVPVRFAHSLPLPIESTYQNKQMFSLFKKIDNRWYQVRTNTYPAEGACKVWADVITANPSTYSIRRASFSYNEAR